MKKFIPIALFIIYTITSVNGQKSLIDKNALEGIIVEPYYIADSNDAENTEDGNHITSGAVTWRIFVDMKPDYTLQAVYCSSFPERDLYIGTTTEFFNNEDRGEFYGQAMPSNRFDEGSVALDSWVTISAASNNHLAILKSEDADGSIIGGSNHEDNLLTNDDPRMGISLTEADGLLEGIPVCAVTGDTLSFGQASFSTLSSVFYDADSPGPFSEMEGGLWYVPGDIQGPTSSNRVLIGQFTTTGTLSWRLNIQMRMLPDAWNELVGTPTNPPLIKYVHTYHPSDDIEQAGDSLLLILEHPDLTGSINIDSIPVTAKNDLLKVSTCIYPNPASNLTNLKISTIGTCYYRLYDVFGKTLINKKVEVTENYVERIDLSKYSSGIYIIEVYSKGQQPSVHRIIKN